MFFMYSDHYDFEHLNILLRNLRSHFIQTNSHSIIYCNAKVFVPKSYSPYSVMKYFLTSRKHTSLCCSSMTKICREPLMEVGQVFSSFQNTQSYCLQLVSKSIKLVTNLGFGKGLSENFQLPQLTEEVPNYLNVKHSTGAVFLFVLWWVLVYFDFGCLEIKFGIVAFSIVTTPITVYLSVYEGFHGFVRYIYICIYIYVHIYQLS